MSEKKELRWRQRFENFHKSYTLLDQYIQKPIETELERAGIVQFFETTFELSWKLMKDYLEAQGTIARSPREAIKLSFQCGLIDDGYVWIDALS
ncbi:MAG: HI0074 family nucleotidyltransferase substrate-binding subunit, partial [Caldisericia bacterium]|nr:HI0074 family nucleotidyltransferase substrate-binding subunit [Caldisericia bacterium]